MPFHLTFGRLPNNGDAFGTVYSVNGKTGNVELNAADVGAASEQYVDDKLAELPLAPVLSVNGKVGDVQLQAADVDAEPLGAVDDLKTYVDERDLELESSIATKANEDYVDHQDELLQDQIDLKANAQAVNQALSTKADLDESGKVPASQLPSYVDDVLEGRYLNPSTFNDLAGNPYTPETGKVYVDIDTNKTYRWSGMLYVVIGGGGVALGETSETAYRGDRGKIAYDHSLSQGNPHNSSTSDIPEGSRLYFTEARARATILAGLNITNSSDVGAGDSVLTGIGKLQAKFGILNNTVRAVDLYFLDVNQTAPVNAFDTILSAFGKLQGQLNASNAIPMVWVNAATLASITWSSLVDTSKTKLEFSKYQGLIYFRGYITTTSPIGSGGGGALFTHKDSRFMCDVSFSTNPLASFNLANFFATTFSQPAGQLSISQGALGGDTQNIQSTGSLAAGVYHLAPIMVGKAKA